MFSMNILNDIVCETNKYVFQNVSQLQVKSQIYLRELLTLNC